MITIRNIRLIDGTGNEPAEKVNIVIENGKFVRIGSDVPVPENSSVIEGSGLTAIPGLIDMHTHFGGSYTFDYPALGNRHETYDFVRSRTGFLHWGVTTVRSCGDQPEEILSFRDDEKAKKILAPRVVCCGPYIQNPEGHPWATVFFRDEKLKGTTFLFVDQDEPIEAMVDRVAAMGVDFIKVFYAHLDLIKNREDAPRMTEEQLKRVVESAHRNGLKCACHVDGPSEMMAASRAGADTIEHMINVGTTEDTTYTDEMAAVLIENGTAVDPTLIATKSALRPDAPDAFEPAKRGVLKMYRAGVPIAVGCDSGIPHVPFGESIHDELICLNEAGIPAGEVLRLATLGNAQILGMDDRIGSIEAGKEADIVLLREDPLNDLHATKKIALVMKEGRIVRDDL